METYLIADHSCPSDIPAPLLPCKIELVSSLFHCSNFRDFYKTTTFKDVNKYKAVAYTKKIQFRFRNNSFLVILMKLQRYDYSTKAA